jgi:hypothetical protein
MSIGSKMFSPSRKRELISDIPIGSLETRAGSTIAGATDECLGLATGTRRHTAATVIVVAAVCLRVPVARPKHSSVAPAIVLPARVSSLLREGLNILEPIDIPNCLLSYALWPVAVLGAVAVNALL